MDNFFLTVRFTRIGPLKTNRLKSEWNCPECESYISERV